ncbi:MAG: rhodanese-like domain-containing protein [Gammaproteobacteria bacterium]|nr:rhodanese-like domain-containing protein [Gammaproteobacteria bacterium]
MKRYSELLDECRKTVKEIFPWDLASKIESGEKPLILDVREPHEFAAMRINGSICVPRGVLETACEWGFDDTIPALVRAREEEIIVVCRSGNRSLFAAQTMQQMGYKHVLSLQTGLRGWNDYEQPLEDDAGNAVDEDFADDFFASKVSKEQLGP